MPNLLSKTKSRALLFLTAAALSGAVASPSSGFDGVNVNSSTFANQYNGNQIWDGAAFQNMWTQAGGATAAALSLNGTALVQTNDANNGWVQQDTGTSPWELGTGNWTIEISAKVNDTTAANDNFVLWATVGGNRFLLRIAKDAVGYNETGVNLIDGINNADAYHTFRVAYEANNPTGGPNGTYHVWRDNVPISDAGATRVASDATTRLIVGDCCGSIGNPVDPFEIQYVRYSMSGAFSPIGDQKIDLQINRTTGAIVLSNTSGAPLPNIIGYSLFSASGGLTQTGWDKQSTGSNLANDNDQWTTLSAASSVNDLSEAVLNSTGDDNGGDLAATNGSWSFGNVWRRSPFEDVRMELLLDDGTVLTNVADPTADFSISYTGASIPSGDFNFDGAVTAADWPLFKSKYRGSNLAAIGTPLASHLAELYNAGDLNFDGQYTLADFEAFEAAYDAVNGIGSFAAIPEPATTTLLVICGTTFMLIRRGKIKRHLGHFAVLFLIAAGAIGVTSPIALAQNTITNPGTAASGDKSNNAGFAFRADAGTFPASVSPSGSLTDVFALTKMTLKRPDDATTPSFGTGVRQTTDANAPIFLDVYTSLNGGTDAFSGYVGSSTSSIAWSATTQNATYSFNFSNLVLSKSTKYWFVFSEDAIAGEVSNFRQRVATGGSNTGSGDNASGYLLNDTAQAHTQGGAEQDWGAEYVAEFTPVTALKLRVNTTSGAVTLENAGAFNFNVNSYSITSVSSLSTAGWNSLEDQVIGGDPTPGDKNNGDSWEEFDNVGSSFIGEGFLTGNTTVLNGSPLSIGNIFTPGGAQNLAFTYTAANVGGVLNGTVEYFAGPPSFAADFDNDGDVDGADLTEWKGDFGVDNGSDADNDGDSDGNDFLIWQRQFGSGLAVPAATAVPEPSTALLAICSATILATRRMRRLGVSLATTAAFSGLIAGAEPASADVFNDRHYSLGDLSNVGFDTQGVNLAAFPGAIDSGAYQDLLNNGGVTTTNVGVGGLNRPGLAGAANGAVFNGANSLTTAVSLNSPNHTWNTAAFFPTFLPSDGTDDGLYDPPSGVGADGPDPDVSYTPAFPHNYTGIFSRGIQVWAHPTVPLAATRQDVVMDSVMHGIFISATGTWGLQFDSGAIDSGVSVASTLDGNGWAHVMEISGQSALTSGGSAFGGALLVNGVAVAGGNTFYDPNTSGFSIGSNQANDGNFYTGVLDEVRVFLWGDNSNVVPASTNTVRGYLGGAEWGALDLGQDNDWIKQKLASLGVTSPGDVDLNGAINAADATAFVTHWRKTFTVGGLQVGDWVSRQQGDLDYNGTVNLADAFIVHAALDAVGLALNFELLSAPVPEPSTWALLAVGAAGFRTLGRRRARSAR